MYLINYCQNWCLEIIVQATEKFGELLITGSSKGQPIGQESNWQYMHQRQRTTHLDAAYNISLAAPKVDTATKRGMMTNPAFPKTTSPNVCITINLFKRIALGTQPRPY